MVQPESPYTRSIGLAGLIRWMIVVAGVIAIAAAFIAGFYGLAITGVVFLAAAAWLSIRASRAQ